MLEAFTVNDFTAGQELPYAVEIPGHGTLELTLVDAEASGDPRPFSLVFQGPTTPELPQGTYVIDHSTFEAALPLFMVPIARRDDGMRYQVIFG